MKIALFVYLIVLMAPSIGLCVPHQFRFDGVIESAWFIGNPPQPAPSYQVGQGVYGYLYWNDISDISISTFPGPYRVESVQASQPAYWADIFVGDIYFNLNPPWYDIGILDGTEYDRVGMVQTHTSAFSYFDHDYAIDLASMHLIGPGDILGSSSYPSMLDLSLFEQGSLNFTFFALGAGYHFDAGIGINIYNIAPVPEPATMYILLCGIAVFTIYQCRRTATTRQGPIAKSF